MEGLVKLPIQLCEERAHNLGCTSGCRDDVLCSPMAIMPQLLKGAIYNLLSGIDGMARSTKHLVVHEAFLTILS